MKKNFFLIILLLLAGALRLYRISAPVADWHSWRQADTAAVARNFVKYGFDPLRPRYDDLSNIQSGKDNPEGWRMVEFPLYQLTGATLVKLVPSLPIEVSLRLVSVAASLGTLFFLVYLMRRFTDEETAILAGLVYAVMPYAVYYGRTILPEPTATFFALASTTCLVQANLGDIKKKGTGWVSWVLASAVCGALALLVKPTAVFLLLPVGYLFVGKHLFTRRGILSVLLFAAIGLLPLFAWRQWIGKFPEGIPVYEWLLNGNGIRLKGAWFNWLFAERLGKLILGYWGLIPFGVGLLLAPSKKERLFFYSWAIGVFVYFIVFATGNVQHDYYQILVIPAVIMFVAKGFRFVLSGANGSFPKGIRYAGTLGIFLAMNAFSWYTIRTYYWINRPEIVEAGKVADQLLPENAKVIAPYNGDTTFLYQTNRSGWPLGFEIAQKITKGATHYVTVSPTDSDLETRDLARDYTVLVRNEKFAIIDLTRPARK